MTDYVHSHSKMHTFLQIVRHPAKTRRQVPLPLPVSSIYALVDDGPVLIYYHRPGLMSE
jgi:hypothetical protein